MAIMMKCKMCGGDLALMPGSAIATCEYCGTTQTVPRQDNEKRLKQFARANRLRLGCEFDKASAVYEDIIADYEEEAEAYWGLVLCKYGVEYVTDPATSRKIPTCHRSSFDSVMDDPNFDLALENADTEARKLYREEAKALEEIRKGIIEVSSKEAPYDIFICYKETDENGERTLDSVLAQDIYDALTEKGYRTFFARISLEDKLGQEYEPYIFAALNSAKVMLAIGTDYEYYNAVWVKNEWSRFLQLIASGQKKTLIPCFKGIDAYDMPKEFAKLQAQDLGKVGAMQDLLRGIDKILAPAKATVYSGTSGSDIIAETLARAYAFLNEANWDSAKLCLDTVRGYDPNNVGAQIGYLMVELKVPQERKLSGVSVILEDHPNYRLALEYADTQTKERLKEYNHATIYNAALRVTSKKNKSSILRAREMLQSISGYRDTDIKIKELDDRLGELHKKSKRCIAGVAIGVLLIALMVGIASMITTITQYNKAVEFESDGHIREAAIFYGKAGNWRDADEKSSELWNVIAPPNSVALGANHAIGLLSNGSTVSTGYNNYYQRSIQDWKNVISVAVGNNNSVGLTKDRTVLVTGDNSYGQYDTDNWKDICCISAGMAHVVGLKKDGTVIATGYNVYGQCDVSKWTDIVAVAANLNYTLGLKVDGTVAAVGSNSAGQCSVDGWTNITAIAAGNFHTAGLTAAGTVITAGQNTIGQCNVSAWTDIVDIAAGVSHTVGLKSDGTVVATGRNTEGQCNVFGWQDIVAIYAGGYKTIGVRADGSVVVAGQDTAVYNVSGWTDIAVN